MIGFQTVQESEASDQTPGKRLSQGQRRRKDFSCKQASALVKSSDLIAYEDLNIAHHHLAKSISDASWGMFLGWVRSYGQVHGIPIVAVSPRFTTQDCSGCGFRVKKTLSMRTYVCPSCGLVLDRDHNAALNILAAARLLVAARNRTAGQAGTGAASAARSHFWTDRHDALCSQGHEALGLDEGRISRF